MTGYTSVLHLTAVRFGSGASRQSAPVAEALPNASDAESNMRVNLFAYGSLQLPEVMAAVTGRRFSGVPAYLPGYARYALRHRRYPGLRPRRGHGTAGVLYRDVDLRSLARLDAFEDDFYRRVRLPVILGTEQRVLAEVYVVAPPSYRLFEPRAWDLAGFGGHFLKAYLRRCRRGFTAVPGARRARPVRCRETEVARAGQSR